MKENPVYLTPQQRRIVEYIHTCREKNGVSPSYSEIARFLGIHKGAVQWHLQNLVSKGILIRQKGRHRSLDLSDETANWQGATVATRARTMPLLGSIVAGLPEEEQENRSELDPIEFLMQGDDCFLLRVRGESMIEAHIQEGDLVAVDPTKRAKDGDIVVALVDGESTLKTLRKKGTTAYLEPANRNMPKQILGNEGQIQGVVIGLLRRI